MVLDRIVDPVGPYRGAPAQRQEALRIAEEHRTAWLTGYRGVLGFVTVVFHDVAAGSVTATED